MPCSHVPCLSRVVLYNNNSEHTRSGTDFLNLVQSGGFLRHVVRGISINVIHEDRIAVGAVRQTQHVRVRRAEDQVLYFALALRGNDFVRAAPAVVDGPDSPPIISTSLLIALSSFSSCLTNKQYCNFSVRQPR